MCNDVAVGAAVRAVGSTVVERVVRVVNVYGPAVVTDAGRVHFYGAYEVVDEQAAAGFGR
jgi:hypothetical protein